VLAGTDHAMTTHESLSGSLQSMGHGEFADELPRLILAWVARVEGR
jgi:hypothetical protein